MMVLKFFQDHNDQVDKLVGRDFAAGTAERYRTAGLASYELDSLFINIKFL
jgi:hypothetical protein